jgi:hypothetical protein
VHNGSMKKSLSFLIFSITVLTLLLLFTSPRHLLMIPIVVLVVSFVGYSSTLFFCALLGINRKKSRQYSLLASIFVALSISLLSLGQLGVGDIIIFVVLLLGIIFYLSRLK